MMILTAFLVFFLCSGGVVWAIFKALIRTLIAFLMLGGLAAVTLASNAFAHASNAGTEFLHTLERDGPAVGLVLVFLTIIALFITWAVQRRKHEKQIAEQRSSTDAPAATPLNVMPMPGHPTSTRAPDETFERW